MGRDDLNQEMQAKARAAQTPEELEKLAEENGQELSDDMLESIAGGIDMPELPDERIDCRGFFIS